MMRLLKGIWRVLSGISRAISVLVPLLFVAIFVIAFSTTLSESTPEPLPERAALLISPSGPLVEDSPPGDTLSAFLNQDYDQPTLLNDVVRSIRWAATDERITALVFDLENLAGPSTSQTLEISSAINVFKASGKPVIAAGDFYSQAHYLLASQADQILLHPEGGMFLEGFSVYRSYLRSFLEKIRVTMHVFRAGENKSAVEPYLRDDMSEVGRVVLAGSQGSGPLTPSSPSRAGNCRREQWMSSSHPSLLSLTHQTTIWQRQCWLRAGSICLPTMPRWKMHWPSGSG